jgi:surface antigen
MGRNNSPAGNAAGSNAGKASGRRSSLVMLVATSVLLAAALSPSLALSASLIQNRPVHQAHRSALPKASISVTASRLSFAATVHAPARSSCVVWVAAGGVRLSVGQIRIGSKQRAIVRWRAAHNAPSGRWSVSMVCRRAARRRTATTRIAVRTRSGKSGTGLLVVPGSPHVDNGAQMLAGAALCTGYTACNASGHTSHGYNDTTNQHSYWGAYPGHNCTNYVAYVETNTYHATNPGNGLGNAYSWGTTAPLHGATVNHTPTVGAVAWWNSTAGLGSDGHVAIVEAVGNGTVTVSEDAFPEPGSSGNFDWKTYSTASITGFIHFSGSTEKPPVNPPPRVTGTANGGTPIKGVQSGRCVDVPNGSTAAGT